MIQLRYSISKKLLFQVTVGLGVDGSQVPGMVTYLNDQEPFQQGLNS